MSQASVPEPSTAIVTKFDFGTGTPIVITQDTGSGSVGRGLFAKTGITEFTWPISGREITVAGDADGVVTLPASIFYGCQSLKKVTIGYGVTHIGASAFSGATIRLIASNSGNVGQVKLDELTLPTSLVEFSGSAFSNCLGVEYVHIVDGNGVVTQSTTPGLWDLTKTRLKTVQRSAFDGLSYISLSNPSVPVGTGITEIRFPSTIRAFYNTALSRAQIGGKKLYLPDVFKPAAGDGTIPAVAAENAGKEYIFTSNSSTNSVFANITPAPIYTYVPASDWGTINWEN